MMINNCPICNHELEESCTNCRLYKYNFYYGSHHDCEPLFIQQTKERQRKVLINKLKV